jgi:hypothetical protein
VVTEIGRRVSGGFDKLNHRPAGPLPEPVEGSSGDFSAFIPIFPGVLSFGGSKRKNIEDEFCLLCLLIFH